MLLRLGWRRRVKESRSLVRWGADRGVPHLAECRPGLSAGGRNSIQRYLVDEKAEQLISEYNSEVG